MQVEWMGQTLTMQTDPGLFSPQHPDRGTLAMLSWVKFQPGQKILDLGCGWGLVGIYCAKLLGQQSVTMLDVDPVAVECARANCLLNGLSDLRPIVSDAYDALDDAGFTLIMSNPPYHADFAVPRRFIEKGFNRLKLGGRLMMVTKRKDWYKNKLISVFGGVHIEEADGYFVFTAEKRSTRYASGRAR